MTIEMALELLVAGLMATTVLAAGLAVAFYHDSARNRSSLEKMKSAFEHLHEGYYRSSLDGRQLCANPALVKLNGYDNEAEMLGSVRSIAKEWYVEPDRRKMFHEILMREGKVVNFVSEIYRHKTRERIWISENARVVFDEETLEPMYYEGTVREITDEIRYREIQDRLVKLAANLPGGLFQMVLRPDGTYSAPYLSNRFLTLLDRQDVPFQKDPRKYLEFVHEDDRRHFKSHFYRSIRNLAPIGISFRYRRKDGTIVWLKANASVERQDDGSTTWYGHIFDVTEQKVAEEKTRQLAYTDALTKLPTRSVAQDRLNSVIAQCDRRKEHAACLFMDLDNFKNLNDVHGHETGDELLVQVTRRLKRLMRATDLMARYGGDEFVFVIDNLGTDLAEAKEKAMSFASKLCSSFKEEFDLGSIEHTSSPSIGVAIVEPGKPSADEIIKRADTAMYQAKKNGRNNFVMYGGQPVGRQSGLANYQKDLELAIERDEFELVFQPQVDAEHKIVGAEAFIRWNHPQEGTLTPGEFMPVAEKSGAIVAINDWVISQAISTLKEWEQSPQTGHLSLAINLGIQQFSINDFPTKLESRLYNSGVERSKLVFELTESTLNRNPDRVRTKMLELKGCGIRFALDDFGIGSSSLASLSNLPFDQVKIDGLLVSTIESDAQNRSLIDGILGVAKALKLETVAEHVGNSHQEAFLRERGCDHAQGYYYYPPLTASDFADAVATNSKNKRFMLVG